MSASDNPKNSQRKTYNDKNINNRKKLSNARSKKKNYLEAEHSMAEGDFDNAFKNKQYELNNNELKATTITLRCFLGREISR